MIVQIWESENISCYDQLWIQFLGILQNVSIFFATCIRTGLVWEH